MNRTLYISDLDGTLLNSNQRVSENSCRIINSLVEKGMLFSYATARSVHTAKKAADGLTAKIPLIVYNGAFIIDNQTMERIAANTFTEEESSEIYEALMTNEVYPIVYSLINNVEKFSYNTKTLSKGLSHFIGTRKGDFRDRPLGSEDGILDGEKFYFTCVDDEAKLFRAYTALKDKYNCLFQKDLYGDYYMFEVMPTAATKAHAILQLKDILSCDKVISFGDALNDIPMAEISDEFYAVGNAVPKIKEIAAAVIDSNDNDGVANWLLENF